MEVSARIKGIASGGRRRSEPCSQGIKEYSDPDNIRVHFVIIRLYNKAHELEWACFNCEMSVIYSGEGSYRGHFCASVYSGNTPATWKYEIVRPVLIIIFGNKGTYLSVNHSLNRPREKKKCIK